MGRFNLPLIVLAMLLPGLSPAAEPGAMDANAPVPSLQYNSSLGKYLSYREAKVGSWKQHNAAAGENTGEGSQPMEQQMQPPATVSPHAGHHMDHKE